MYSFDIVEIRMTDIIGRGPERPVLMIRKPSAGNISALHRSP